MKPTPKGWPRISAAVFYDDAAKAIDWLCEVFGFEVRLKVAGEGGRIEHCELVFGEGLIMVGSTGKADRPSSARRKSPRSLGGANTISLCLCIDDVDAHCARARSLGAKILTEPETNDYGEEYWADRSCEVEDLEGHQWWFLQRVREQGQPRTA